MGGGSSTKTETTTEDPEARATQKVQREKILAPLIATFMPQWLSSLTSGTTEGPQLQAVQNEVSGARSNTSGLVSSLKAILAGRGGLGTPFGTRQVSRAQIQGEQEAASIAPNIALDWFRQVPGMITGTGQTLVNSGGTKTSSSSFLGSDSGASAGQLIGGLSGAALLYGMLQRQSPTVINPDVASPYGGPGPFQP